MNTAGKIIKRGVSPRGFEVTIVREPNPQSHGHHFGVYRRGLSEQQAMAGKLGAGQGQGRWTPDLGRAETIFALFVQDVTDPSEFGRSGARTAGKAI